MAPSYLCPQGGRATRMHQECDYLQMIEMQRRQCLEEAQLENETAGEALQSPRYLSLCSQIWVTFLPHVEDGRPQAQAAPQSCRW